MEVYLESIFNPEKSYQNIVNGLMEWRTSLGFFNKVVIGVSGGLDSTFALSVCVDAFGSDNVIGIVLPDGTQHDIDDAYTAFSEFGIKPMVINIGGSTWSLLEQLPNYSKNAQINLAPRIRMSTLFLVAQTYAAMVINTCNKSESFVGYDTIFGDNLGSFAPLADYTKSEIYAMSKWRGISNGLVDKTPIDGLFGNEDEFGNFLSDEERFGFSYAQLDKYIRTGSCGNRAVDLEIQKMNKSSQFKRDIIKLPFISRV